MGEKTKCPICETEVEKEAFKDIYISPYNNQEYKRYECPNCNLHWWEPLKIIPEFYESEVFECYTVFHEVAGVSLNDNHKAFFKYFPKEVKGMLLDVGCGDGRFIRHAKEHGFEVWGIDFDKKSVENVRKSLGIDTVFAMSLEDFYEYAKKNNLKFDVITFFEVLEHQDKPREFLQMVKGLLKDGGYIAGSVPNRERLFTEIDWRYFYGDYPPHHFLRFSKSSLEKALTLCSFRDVEVHRLDFPFKELFPYLEKKVFGNLDGIKRKLKAKALGDKRKALAYAVEDLPSAGANKGVALFLLILKYLRNLLLLLYVGKRKGNSLYMYFQAKLK